MKKIDEIWMTNRDRSRRPKKFQGWCGCDRNIVAPYEKCVICNSRIKDHRNKRD